MEDLVYLSMKIVTAQSLAKKLLSVAI
jgi:hypothetical protein